MKSAVKSVLYASGYYHFLGRVTTLRDKRFLILMYHDIVEDSKVDAKTKGIWEERPTRSQFAAHLEALWHHFRIVSIDQILAEIAAQRQLKENLAAITFDDGYESVYKIAFPLLKEYHIPATIYLATNWIDGRMTPWWDTLRALMNNENPGKLTFEDFKRIPGVKMTKELAAADNNMVSKILLPLMESILRNMDDGQREEIMGELKSMLSPGSNPDSLRVKALSWSEITEMSASGMLFGSHTCSHINIKQSSDQRLEEEIVESKREIEKKLGKKVVGFAYPYGEDLLAYRRTEPLLRRHGFIYACTAAEGNNKTLSHPFRLRRITLPNTKVNALLGAELMEYLSRPCKNSSFSADRNIE